MGTFHLPLTMTAFKFISFELKMEFEIDDTDYDVVWSLDNNAAENDGDNMIEGISDQEKEDNGTVEEYNNVKNMDNSEIGDMEIFEEENRSEDTESESKYPEKGEKDKGGQATEKETVFGKQVDLFLESWGLPPQQDLSEEEVEKVVDGDDSDASIVKTESDALSVKQTIEMNGEKTEGETIILMKDESKAQQDLIITTEVRIVKGSVEKNDSEEDANQIDVDFNQGEEKDDPGHLFDETIETKKEWIMEGTKPCDSTEVNIDEDSDYQSRSIAVDTPEETIVGGNAKLFTLKLGAGSRSIKLHRKSSNSTPGVFTKSSEGLLADEEVEDFCRAWAAAVTMYLERRVAAGHSFEEIMEGLMMEVGLDKFTEIVEHYLGSLTLEKIENDSDM